MLMSVVPLQKQLPHLIWMDTPVKHRAVEQVTASTLLGSHCKPLTVRAYYSTPPGIYHHSLIPRELKGCSNAVT